MDFVKAAEIATQFEKDFSKIYKLEKIEDKRQPYQENWFACVYANKITHIKEEILFPEDALETCRIDTKGRTKELYKYKEIVINGCNTFWDASDEKSIMEDSINLLMQEYSEHIEKIIDERFDLKGMYTGDIQELQEKIKEIYKQIDEE